MKRLKVNRFQQDPCCCAVAACASIINYYNTNINYTKVKEIAEKKVAKTVSTEGLTSGETCSLLNILGFNKVVLISSDINLFDYQWVKYKKKRMINTLKEAVQKKKNRYNKATLRDVYKWYKKTEYDNQIIIDYDFGKYIRQQLNKGKPVLLSFNWTIFFKYEKSGKYSVDPINGEYEEHAVVSNGYDKKGVWIIDSHHQYYKYRRKKYRKGFYKISWENLMTVIGMGDVILPDNFCEK